MPFPTNPALEAAVVADAENDLPRLVYADWLDENGDPARAAFIRAQIALHDKHPADPDYPNLLEARREAFDAVTGRSDMSPKLPRGFGFYDEFHDPDSDSLLDPPRGYHRGFPHVARLPEGALTTSKKVDCVIAALPEVFARTTVRGLFSDDQRPEQLIELLHAPECVPLTALSLDTRITSRDQAGEVGITAGSPTAETLRWLTLSPHDGSDALRLATADFPRLVRWEARRGFECDFRDAERLFNVGWFGRLHRLLCSLDADQAQAFWAACAANKSLHTLEFTSAEPRSFLPLAKTKTLTGLGRLELDFDTEYRADDDIAALVRAKLPKLRAFKFTGGALRHDTHKELFAADWFARLRVLELESNHLDDRTANALGRSAVSEKLRSLTFTAAVLARKTWLSLADGFPQLTTLDLSAPALLRQGKPADLTAFLGALAMPRLRHLTLSSQAVNDAGAVALARNPALTNLTRLDLGASNVGDRGLRAVARSPHLQRLSCLNLAWTEVGEGAELLADSDVLPNLVFCWLPQGVSKKVMNKLRKKRGEILHVRGR